jgi:cytidine deaminase
MQQRSEVKDPSSRHAELMEAARKACRHSYSPYSKFQVGAALLTEDGTIYTGTNIENANAGSGICAERTAVVKAAADGHRRIVRIAVVSPNATECYPCGVCRQVIAEFADRLILLVDAGNGHIKTVEFSNLLPTLESLER